MERFAKDVRCGVLMAVSDHAAALRSAKVWQLSHSSSCTKTPTNAGRGSGALAFMVATSARLPSRARHGCPCFVGRAAEEDEGCREWEASMRAAGG